MPITRTRTQSTGSGKRTSEQRVNSGRLEKPRGGSSPRNNSRPALRPQLPRSPTSTHLAAAEAPGGPWPSPFLRPKAPLQPTMLHFTHLCGVQSTCSRLCSKGPGPLQSLGKRVQLREHHLHQNQGASATPVPYGLRSISFPFLQPLAATGLSVPPCHSSRISRRQITQCALVSASSLAQSLASQPRCGVSDWPAASMADRWPAACRLRCAGPQRRTCQRPPV